MSQLKTLFAKIEDPTVSDAEVCLALDLLAAALNAVMQGPDPFPEKIEAIRFAQARG